MIYLSRDLIKHFSFQEIELPNWGKVVILQQDENIFFYDGQKISLITSDWIPFSHGSAKDEIICYEYFHLDIIKYIKVLNKYNGSSQEYIYKLCPHDFNDGIKLSDNSIRISAKYLKKEKTNRWDIVDEGKPSCCVLFNPYLFGDFYIDIISNAEIQMCDQYL